MLNAATYDKAIATSDFERLIACLDTQVPRHDIGHLIMGMAMRPTSPTLFHAVLGEKQLGVIGTDASLEPRLRRCGLDSAARHMYHIRK
jgi:hypothetical protein